MYLGLPLDYFLGFPRPELALPPILHRSRLRARQKPFLKRKQSEFEEVTLLVVLPYRFIVLIVVVVKECYLLLLVPVVAAVEVEVGAQITFKW